MDVEVLKVAGPFGQKTFGGLDKILVAQINRKL